MTHNLCRASAFVLAGAVATTLPTAGCTNRPYASPEEQAQNACHAFGPKALSGALLGGVGGAAAGAGIGALAGGGRGAAIGAGVGALAGLFGGLAIGSNMDARDCAQAQQALAQVQYARLGQPVTWSSPSGSHGSYTPLSAEYQTSGGQICRKVNQDVTLAGHAATSGNVITCRTPDGNYTTVQPDET